MRLMAGVGEDVSSASENLLAPTNGKCFKTLADPPAGF
jgi:hypothetical protein